MAVAQPGPRTVAFDYGDDCGSLDSLLSRVTGITYSDPVLGVRVSSAYSYAGATRRVGMSYGDSTPSGQCLWQSFVDGGGYSGLDTFGRIRRLDYRNGAGTAHYYQYDYDKAGNRLWAKVSQPAHPNTHSYLYTYDALRRLLSAERGELITSPGPPMILPEGGPTGAPAPVLTEWHLDNLGNWSESDEQAPYGEGRTTYVNGAATERVLHETDSINEIVDIYTDGVHQCPDVEDPPQEITFGYDGNGNLTDDCWYTYHYDAFNHLIEVKEGGQNVVWYAYDGLGRLITKTWDQGERRMEYYYDGVRRIQEVLTTNDPNPGDHVTDREYVYGPDYVDQFVAQIDGQDNVAYVVQDANYNVMGLFDAAGVVLAQYIYTPYGRVVDAEVGAMPFDNRIGHQGLFFDRLDDPNGSALASMAQNPIGLYYNRARFYDPATGRFTQRDPNGTATPLFSSVAHAGRSLLATLGPFEIQLLYGDGMNLFAYLNANPFGWQDPLGLVGWDQWDEWIDENRADIYAERAVFAQQLFDFSMAIGRAVAIGALQTAITAIFPPAGLVFSAVGLRASIDSMLSEGLTFGNVIGAAVSLWGVGQGASATFRMASRFQRTSAKLICHCFVAGTLVDTPDGAVPIEELRVGDEVFTRHESEAPECAGSWIEERSSPAERTGGADPHRRRTGRVTRVFRNLAPAILWFTLANGTVLGTTPGHRVWTHEDGWTFAGHVEIADTLVDYAGEAVAIVAVELDPTATPVYNIEVAGTFTYFVSGLWVHNTSGACYVPRAGRPTGRDWAAYFRDKYGRENVEWSSLEKLRRQWKKSKKKIIAAWEEAHGTSWPRTRDGRPYTPHHDPALSEGGTIFDIVPIHPNVHSRMHAGGRTAKPPDPYGW